MLRLVKMVMRRTEEEIRRQYSHSGGGGGGGGWGRCNNLKDTITTAANNSECAVAH